MKTPYNSGTPSAADIEYDEKVDAWQKLNTLTMLTQRDDFERDMTHGQLGFEYHLSNRWGLIFSVMGRQEKWTRKSSTKNLDHMLLLTKPIQFPSGTFGFGYMLSEHRFLAVRLYINGFPLIKCPAKDFQTENDICPEHCLTQNQQMRPGSY